MSACAYFVKEADQKLKVSHRLLSGFAPRLWEAFFLLFLNTSGTIFAKLLLKLGVSVKIELGHLDAHGNLCPFHLSPCWFSTCDPDVEQMS